MPTNSAAGILAFRALRARLVTSGLQCEMMQDYSQPASNAIALITEDSLALKDLPAPSRAVVLSCLWLLESWMGASFRHLQLAEMAVDGLCGCVNSMTKKTEVNLAQGF